HIVFTAGGETIRHEQTPAYSGTKIIYTINENVPGQTFVVPAAGGTPLALPATAGGGFGGRPWLGPRPFVVDRSSPRVHASSSIARRRTSSAAHRCSQTSPAVNRKSCTRSSRRNSGA